MIPIHRHDPANPAAIRRPRERYHDAQAHDRGRHRPQREIAGKVEERGTHWEAMLQGHCRRIGAQGGPHQVVTVPEGKGVPRVDRDAARQETKQVGHGHPHDGFLRAPERVGDSSKPVKSHSSLATGICVTRATVGSPPT
jgi:hypothetical protein